MNIYSNNEWDNLKEVIIGNTFGVIRNQIDLSFKYFYNDLYDWGWLDSSSHVTQIKQKFVDELDEDLENFVSIIKKQNIKVHRPNKMNKITKIVTPNWTSETLPPLNVRDQVIILGNTIVETPPMLRNRYFENDSLKHIFYSGFKSGARWLNLPKSTLSDTALNDNTEMMIDGAQFVRFGKDIIVNVSNQSHQLAVEWFIREFPQYNFHIIKSLVMNHLDSFVVPLCEGVLLLRNTDFLEMMPDFLKDWKIIYPPKPSQNQFPIYDDRDLILTTPFIDMNVLSIDGNKIICNSLFPELNELLYKEGFDPIPVQHRHRRIFAGGFHCFTLDLLREKK